VCQDCTWDEFLLAHAYKSIQSCCWHHYARQTNTDSTGTTRIKLLRQLAIWLLKSIRIRVHRESWMNLVFKNRPVLIGSHFNLQF
jgi:hypothetical protein